MSVLEQMIEDYEEHGITRWSKRQMGAALVALIEGQREAGNRILELENQLFELEKQATLLSNLLANLDERTERTIRR